MYMCYSYNYVEAKKTLFIEGRVMSHMPGYKISPTIIFCFFYLFPLNS